MGNEPPQRRDNGLRADQFVALADVDPRLGEHLLDLLRLAEIPAYLEPSTDPRVAVRYRVSGPVERLYVQADQRREARAVVVAAAHEAGEATTPEPTTDEPDLLHGIDTDAEFARIVSGFGDVPETSDPALGDALDRPGFNRAGLDPAALDAAALERAQERAEEAHRAELADDPEDHFHPPPAPPVPFPAANTVAALFLIVFGLAVIIRGDEFGLAAGASFPIGVLLILTGSGLLIRGLRDRPHDDSDDDGAQL